MARGPFFEKKGVKIAILEGGTPVQIAFFVFLTKNRAVSPIFRKNTNPSLRPGYTYIALY